jgi:predicted transcriptional regulator
MALENKLVAGILRDEGGFREAFREVLDEDLKMTVHEFCTSTGLSPSTIYKIMQDRREPNLRTVREIIRAVRKLENRPGGNFIAVIGMNCTIVEGAVIGEGCIIGAGAVVTGRMNIPPRSLVIGVPAKIVRSDDPSLEARALENARDYHKLRDEYLSGKHKRLTAPLE